MKVVLTGHDGLIGSKIQETLEKNGDYVIGIDRKSYIEVSEMNSKFLIDCLCGEIDLVIHCAANCIIRDMIKRPEISFANVEAIFNIFEFARKTGCKKVVYFSSSRVGHNVYNPYVASKIYGEEIAKAYKECYGIDYLIIRPETVWSLHDKHVRVVTKWIQNAINNEPLIVYGDKNKELPPIHVNDFALAFFDVLSDFLSGKVIDETITISGDILKVDKIIKIIKKLTKSKSEVIYEPEEISQPQLCANADIICGDFERSLKEELK